MRVAPCSNVGTNLQCEMDPVSQAKASNDLAQHGLDVVGWYHSHPTFAPTPSLRDIDTQSTFQVSIFASVKAKNFLLIVLSCHTAWCFVTAKCWIMLRKVT